MALLCVLAALMPLAVRALQVEGRFQTSLSSLVPASVDILPVSSADFSGPQVQVALHVRNIYGLSLIDQSFLAEGWYSLKWGADLQERLQRLNIDPDELIELANEIELGQFSSRQSTPMLPTLLEPGRFGRVVRFSGKFFVQDVPQRFAPFDPQRLTIAIEVKPDPLAYGLERLRLVPANSAASIVGEDLVISGFILQSITWEESQVIYPAEFQPDLKYSRITAVFQYGKSAWAMFLKWVFPVVIVMAIVIVSPSIEGVLGDIRIAIPPSALLTLVVMQDSYKNSFPPAPYLTYLDELYVYSYIVCLAIFLLFLVGTNLLSRAVDADRERLVRRVNRMDWIVQLSLVVGFVVVAVAGWYT